MINMQRAMNITVIILCYLPLIYLFSFYSFILRGATKLGYMPGIGAPDPKDLGYTFHRELVSTLLNVAYIGSMVLIGLAVVLFALKRLTVAKIHLILFVAGVVIAFISFFTDSMEWFAD
jgi:hypothetical protein